MICVTVEPGTGVIHHATGETAPVCSEYLLLTSVEADRLTYWADLAIALEPGGGAFWPLVTAMVTAMGAVLALRFVLRQLRTVTREA